MFLLYSTLLLGVVSLIISCHKDDKLVETDSLESRSTNSQEEAEVLDDNFLHFYDSDYVSEGLGLTTNSDVDIDYLIEQVSSGLFSGELAHNFSSLYGNPCWDCAISTNSSEIPYYIVPVVDVSESFATSYLLVPVEDLSNKNTYLVDRLSAGSNLFESLANLFDSFDNVIAGNTWNPNYSQDII